MKQNLSITMEEELVKYVDKKVDGIVIKNRSHAIENFVNKAFKEEKKAR